jgi:hypothetical protein
MLHTAPSVDKFLLIKVALTVGGERQIRAVNFEKFEFWLSFKVVNFLKVIDGSKCSNYVTNHRYAERKIDIAAIFVRATNLTQNGAIKIIKLYQRIFFIWKIHYTSLVNGNCHSGRLIGDPLVKLLSCNCSLIKSIADQAGSELFQAFFLHAFEGFPKGGLFLFRDIGTFEDLSVDQVADRVGVELDRHYTKYGREPSIVLQKVNAFGCYPCGYDWWNWATNLLGAKEFNQPMLLQVVEVICDFFFIFIIKLANDAFPFRWVNFSKLFQQLSLEFSVQHKASFLMGAHNE